LAAENEKILASMSPEQRRTLLIHLEALRKSMKSVD
jgi:hypothetical protein